MKVLIVGGGIGGLAAMRCLSNAGHHVQLIEKRASFNAQGAGLMLGINAMKVLETLGVANEVVLRGQPLALMNIVNEKGVQIGGCNNVLMESHTGYKTIGIHRSELHEVLSAHLPQNNIRFNATLSSLKQQNDQVVVSVNGGDEEKYDLMIAADGIHSSTRQLTGDYSRLRYAGYTCWRFVIDRPSSVNAVQAYEYWGCGKRFGVVPIGNDKLYCFATMNSDEANSHHKNIAVNEFKSLFSRFSGVVPEILQMMNCDVHIIHGDLFDQKRLCMQQGRVAFLGDAAHAATPNMGQGAGMALEDVAVLAECLAADVSITDALAVYDTRRRPRVKKIRNRSYMIGKVSQWESSIARRTRNTVLRMIPSDGLSKDLCKLLMDY